MIAVEASQSATYNPSYLAAESSTSGALQRPVALLLRDEAQSSTTLDTLAEPGTVWRPARSSHLYEKDFILKFAEKELTLVSLYAPNVAARIVTSNDPQEIFVMSEPYTVRLIYPAGFDFAVPVLVRGPQTIEKLRSAYVISDAAKIESFIEANQLTEILVQAIEPIKRTFGESRTRTLTVLEDDEGSRTLFCLVAFPGSLDKAEEALDSFDRDWWLKNVRRYGSKLNFDFELV
jgi:hypothetical protein